MDRVSKKRISCTVFTIVAFVFFIAAVLSVSSYTAHAQDTEHDGNTFEVIFPKNNYFQSNDPTYISANASYLLVYDRTDKRLFVRSDNRQGTWSYSVPYENVHGIYAVSNTAFIYADEGYYTVDLEDEHATAIGRELTSPADISYFNTDGTYLYAKSILGRLTVYDEDLNVAFGIDDYFNEDFLSEPVLAGEGQKIYVFKFSYGFPIFVSHDLSDPDDSISTNLTKSVQAAYIGDVIFAKADGNIVGIDKNDGSTLFTADLTPDDFCAYGNRLFAIEDNSIAIYTLKSDRSGLAHSSTISMAGADDKHLNAPADVVYTDSGLYIADSKNSRLLSIDQNGNTTQMRLEHTPLRLTNSATDIYVLCDNGDISKISNGEIQSTYSLNGAKDVDHLDKLYVLLDDGVYTMLGNSFIKLCDIQGGRRIASNEDGSNIYVLKDDGIVAIDQNGKILPTTLRYDLTSAKDIIIDYAGNVIAACHSKLIYLKNNVSSLDLQKEVELISDNLKVTLTSATANGSTLYFTADECFIGKTNAELSTKDDFTGYRPPAFDENASYKFIRFKQDAASYMLPADGRAEGILRPTQNVMLALHHSSTPEGYLYAMDGEDLYLVPKDDVEEVACTAQEGVYAAIKPTALYRIPYSDTDAVNIDQGAIVTMISDTAGYDGASWVLVTYNEKTYFARASHFEEYVYVVPEQEKTYGKAKGERVGGLVNVYTEADFSSPVLTKIVDGTKVEILDTVGDYYQVLYQGSIGYMLKDTVKLDGLTTVQIIAIVLAIIVALAGIAISASIHLAKKKSENSSDKK